MESYVPLLRAYSIPHIGLTDYDYCCDEQKGVPRVREQTSDFIILKQRLEEELHSLDDKVTTIENFNPENPCKTKKADQPTSISPTRAYDIVIQTMAINKQKVKNCKLGEVVTRALIKAGTNPDKVW